MGELRIAPGRYIGGVESEIFLDGVATLLVKKGAWPGRTSPERVVILWNAAGAAIAHAKAFHAALGKAIEIAEGYQRELDNESVEL